MDGSGDAPRSSKATVCVFCNKTEKRTQVKGKSKHEKLQLSVPYKKEICKIAEETGNYKVLAAFITEKTCKLMHHSSCYRDFTRKKDRLHHSSPESNSESDPQRDSLSTSISMSSLPPLCEESDDEGTFEEVHNQSEENCDEGNFRGSS